MIVTTSRVLRVKWRRRPKQHRIKILLADRFEFVLFPPGVQDSDSQQLRKLRQAPG